MAGRLPDRIAGAFAARPGAALLVLLAAFALVWLTGLFQVPPIDRDEPRFAQATRQMAESGDLVDIRFQDRPRYAKPIGIYWLQRAAIAVSGEGAAAPIGVYRLVSLLGALAGVALTFWALSAFLAPPAALAATALVAATLLLGGEARLAKTDAALFATIVAAEGALARLWLAARSGARPHLATVLGLWVALGLAILVKGPVGPMVVGLTLAALTLAERRWSVVAATRPILGVAVMALIAAPWLVAIGYESGGAFFGASLGRDLGAKLLSGQEKHWAPPLAHLAAILLTAWPLAPFVVRAGRAIWRERRTAAVTFALAWAVPTWIVLEIVPTKLPHYALPLVPALALAAFAVAGEPPRWAARLAAGLMLLVPLALAAGAIGLPFLLGELPSPVGVGLVVVALVPAGLAARRMLDDARSSGGAVMCAILAAALVQVGVCGFVLPDLRMLFPAPRLVAAAETILPCRPLTLVSVGYREPSLVFLAGTGTRLADADEAATALVAGGCVVAAVDRRFEADFLAAASAAGVAVALHGREGGYNINGGRRLDLGLYTAAGR